MRLEYLRYFVEVALSHSINKAAKNLYISQPALTAAIQSLEKELGFALLNRSPNGVVLTPNGKKIFADACHIIETIDSWDCLRLPENRQRNEIHIIANPPIYHNILTEIVGQLEETYPATAFHVTEALPEKAILNSNPEMTTIALFSRIDRKENSVIRYMKKNHWTWQILAKDYQFIYLSADNPLAYKDYLTIEDLKTLNFARYKYPDGEDFTLSLKKDLDEQNLFYFTNFKEMLKSIENGRAVSAWPNLLMKHCSLVQERKIIGKPLVDQHIPVSHYIAYKNLELMSEDGQRIVESIRDIILDMLLVPA